MSSWFQHATWDSIASRAVWVLGVVFAVAVSINFADGLLGKKPVEHSRYLVWLLFAGAMFLGALGGPLATASLCSLILFRSAIELNRTWPTTNLPIPGWCLGVLAAITPFVAMYSLQAILPYALLVTLGAFCLPLVRGDYRGASSNGARVGLTVLMSASLAYLVVLRSLPGGFGLTLFVVFVTDAANSMAYVFGKMIGRRKLIPSISPGKSVEGAVAATVVTVALAQIFRFCVPELSQLRVSLAALMIALFAQVGDLIFSALKREAGVKDFSRILLAQGGVLDQFDSLFITAPLFYYFVLA